MVAANSHRTESKPGTIDMARYFLRFDMYGIIMRSISGGMLFGVIRLAMPASKSGILLYSKSSVS